MRKFLFVLWILFPFLSYSQSVNDSIRYVSTDFEWVKIDFSDTHPLGIALNAEVKDNEILSYSLTLRRSSIVKISLPENGLLLFKCADGTIIESKQFQKGYNTNRTEGYDAASLLKHIVIGEYPIQEKDIHKLCKNGLIKVRMETMDGYMDMEYSQRKAKKIARTFRELLDSLSNLISLKGNPEYNDIRSNF